MPLRCHAGQGHCTYLSMRITYKLAATIVSSLTRHFHSNDQILSPEHDCNVVVMVVAITGVDRNLPDHRALPETRDAFACVTYLDVIPASPRPQRSVKN